MPRGRKVVEWTSGRSVGPWYALSPRPVLFRLAGVALVTWIAAGLAGCGDTEDRPASAPGPEISVGTTANGPPLSVSIERSRLYGVSRQFYLTFRSTAGADLQVASARLRSELFAPAEPSERSLLVSSSGDPIAIPIDYGAASCRHSPSSELFVRVDVDGRSSDVPLGKAAPDILREHASECAGNEVRRQVDVRVGSDWKRVGAARVSGTLSLDRRAGAEAVLDGVATSVVFSVEVLSSLPATDDVDIEVTAARCDAHALTESKKTFTFFLTFTTGDGDPVVVELPVEEGPAHDALDAAIEECVASGDGG